MLNRVPLGLHQAPLVVKRLIMSHLGTAGLTSVINQELHKVAISVDKDICQAALSQSLGASHNFVDAAKLIQLKLRYLTHTMPISKHCRVSVRICVHFMRYINVYITPNHIIWFHTGNVEVHVGEAPLPKPLYFIKPNMSKVPSPREFLLAFMQPSNHLWCKGIGFNVDSQYHPLVDCKHHPYSGYCVRCGVTGKAYPDVDCAPMETLGIFIHGTMNEDNISQVKAIQEEFLLWSK